MKRLNLKQLSIVSLLSLSSALTSSCNEETLAIRRIASCYQDNDFTLTDQLIEEFKKNYPGSSHAQQLLLLKASSHLQKKEWQEAISYYEKIQDSYLQKESFIQKMHCYYALKDYPSILAALSFYKNEVKTLPKQEQQLATFYHAESLLKENPKELKEKDLTHISNLYKSLLSSPLKKFSALSLAQVYSLLNKHALAAKYFKESADEFEAIKDKLLFYAGAQEKHFDLDQALATFDQIKDLKSSTEEKAFYNWMVLLYESDNYEKLIESQESLILQTPSSKLADTHLILGKSHFKQKDFDAALGHFDESLKHRKISDQKEQVALLALLTTYQLGDLEKLEPYFSLLEKKYKSSKEYIEALFWKAKLLQNQQQLSKATQLYQKILKLNSKDFALKANYQLGLLNYNQNQFIKASEYFSKILHLNFKSPYAKPALSYLIQSCFKELNKKENPKVKEKLIEAQYLALKMENYFSNEQKPGAYLSIAKLHLDLGQEKKFKQCIQTFFKEYKEDAKAYQGYLLLAYQAKKNQKDLQSYLSYLEKALASNPPSSLVSQIHADLFYGYLEKSKLKDDPSLAFEKATPYCLKLIESHFEIPRKLEQWFCQVYFLELEKKLEEPEKESLLVKGATLLSHYLKDKDWQSLADQRLAFHYATLLGWQNKLPTKLEVLETLSDKVNLKDTIYAQVLLEKALCLEALSQPHIATSLYKKIVSESYSAPLKVSLKAKLHLARLLAKEYFKAPQLELLKHIQKLYKDLYCARSIKTEPIHLEAAIDSAFFDFKSSKGELSSYLKSLVDLKEDFMRQDTVLSKEYHDMRKTLSEQNKIFESYLSYIDVCILNLQMHLKNELLPNKANFCKELLSRLESSESTPYLKEAVDLQKRYLIDGGQAIVP